MLARAGLHLGVTTVHRILKEREPIREDAAGALTGPEALANGVVTARRPDHVWHVDLTTVPTCGGFWVPWLPHAWPQSWPFCWWVAVVIDHFSRAVIGFAVFLKRPSSAEVQQCLEQAIRRAGAPPKYLISDKGSQFWCDSYKRWCQRRRIKPRFGAVRKHGSIAVVERFIRSLNDRMHSTHACPVRPRSDATRAHLLRRVVQRAPAKPGTRGTNAPRSV
jgi:transposase InsO family protein